MTQHYKTLFATSARITSRLYTITLVLSFILSAGFVSGQGIANYTYAASSGTYTAISGGTTWQSGATVSTDAISTAITIPFSFTYNYRTYTTLNISNNGFISFGPISPAAANYTPISNSSVSTTAANGYDGAISGFGCNLVASAVSGSSPSIIYGTSGSDFVIQFTDMARSAVTTDRITFQIRLTQTTNVVKIVYGTCVGSASTTIKPQVGLRGASGFDWKNLTATTTWTAPTSQNTAGTSTSGSTITYSSTYFPASGQTYTWTPPTALGAPTYASLPASENFDGSAGAWANGNTTNDLPNAANWRTWPSYGDRSWRKNAGTTGVTTGWNTVSGNPAIAAPATGSCASINCYDGCATAVGDMDYYVDFTPTGTKTMTFSLINPGGYTLKVLLSTDGGTTFSLVNTYSTAVAAWANQSLALGSSTSATCVVRFEGTTYDGSSGYNISVDNVNIYVPAVPTVTSFTPTTPLCTVGGQTVTLTGTNFTGATAVKFGTTNATSFVVNSATTITAVAPVLSAGGNIFVTTAGGTNTAATGNAYTVATPVTPTIAPATATYCGAAVTLTASGASSYVWSNGPVTAADAVSPTATTTYTVTSTDANACTATASRSVTFGIGATTLSATASPTAVCSGSTSTITAKALGPVSATQGAGGTTGSNYDAVFDHVYGGCKTQFMIRASEMTALGFVAGPINSLGINMSTVTAMSYAGFAVNIAQTTNTDMSAGLNNTATFTQVYSNASYSPTTGINTFGFSSPYTWDGTSNIIVQFCWSNNTTGGTSNYAKIDAVGYVSCAYYRADSQTPAVECAATTATATTSNRPQFIINAQGVTTPSFTYTWNPGSGSGNPYSPTVTATTTYTVTATNAASGCTVTANATVNLTSGAPSVSLAQLPTGGRCFGATTTLTPTVTGGCPPYTYAWSAGTTAATAPSVTVAPTANTTYNVTVTDAGSQTASASISITVLGTPPSISPSSATYCGAPVQLTVSPAGATTYAWSGSGLSSTSIYNPTASPTATTTYTVTVTDANACTGTASRSVTFGIGATTLSATASPTAVCTGNTSTITAKALGPVSATQGAGGTTGSSYDAVFDHVYGGCKTQFMIRASEMTALGFVAGPINSLGINMSTVTAMSYAGFAVNIAQTTNTDMSAGLNNTATFTQVYSNASYSPTTGINTFGFSSPYTWDGTSNIIIQICWSNNTTGGTSNYAKIDAVGYVSCAYYRADSQTPAVECAATTATATTSNRPQFIINAQGVTTPSFTYTWNPGSGSGNPYSPTITATTTYTVTATHASGCTFTANATVNLTSGLPSVSLAQLPTGGRCYGATTTLTPTVTGGCPPYTYAWSAGTTAATAPSVTVAPTANTTYNVTVTDAGSQTASASISISVLGTPPSISPSSASYCGAPVQLTVSPAGATTYAWSGSGLSSSSIYNPTASPSATTTYTVTVTDANACTGTASRSVTFGIAATTLSATAVPTSVCSGSTSTITAKALGAVSATQGAGGTTGSSYDAIFYHYYGGCKTQFMIRASEMTALGFVAGPINSLGINMSTVTAQTYAGFAVNIAQTTNTDMSAGLNSTATFTQVYSNASYSPTTGINTFGFSSAYNWDGTSNIIVQFCWSNNNTGGTSNYAKIDAVGYVACAYYRADSQTPATECGATTATATTSNRPQFIINAQGVTTPSFTYTWNPGSGSGNPYSPTVTATTTYTVTATHAASGCTVTANATVNLSTGAPSVSLAQSPAGSRCPGATTTLTPTVTGGCAPFTYAWSAGTTAATAPSVTVAPTTNTTYSVTVTDAGSQTASTSISITVVGTPAAISSAASTYCSTPVQLTATPAGATTYAWSGAGLSSTSIANPTATPTVATTYTVTVTDATGCTSTASTSIAKGNPFALTATATPATICTGNNSQLIAEVSGTGTYCTAAYTTGTGSSDYITNVHLGSINNTTGASATPYNTYYSALSTNLTAGTAYTLTGTINDGGSYEYAAVWIDYNNDGVFSSAEKVGETIAGTAVGGNRPFSITFTVPLTALNSTTRMRVRNAYNTTGIDPCNSYTYGEVEDYNVVITGGGDYTYSWSASSSPSFLSSTTISNPMANSVTAARTYTVTVTEAAGCIATASAAISIASGTPSVSLAQSPAGTFCPGSLTTLTPTVTGGCPPYTYAWSAGTSAATPPAVTVSPLITTTYTVTVTDNNSQTATASIPVAVYVVTAAAITPSSAMICGTGGVTLTTTPAGAASYAWSGTALSSTTIANPVASPTSDQNYSVTVTDANACTSTASVTIPVFSAVTVSSTTASPPTICAGSNSQLQVTASQGSTGAYCTGAYNYGTTSGDYITNVTLGSINNTTGASSSPFNTYYSALSTNLTGGSTYTMTGTVDDGGTEGVAAWIDYNNDGVFSSTEQLGVVIAGATVGTDRPFSITFTVPTTALNGTLRMRVRNVYNHSTIDPCNTYNYGEIEDYNVVVSGATAPAALTYTWATAPTLSATNIANPVATSVPATTTYTVTVTGVGGCSATGTTTVNIGSGSLTVSLGQSPAGSRCAGYTTTLTPTVTGGCAPYTYTWSAGTTPATAPAVTISPATNTTFNVTVTDAGSTTASAAINITVTGSVATLTASAATYCSTPVQLTASPAGASSYAWSGAGLSSGSIYNPTATPTVTTTYTVTVTQASGCTATASTAVGKGNAFVINSAIATPPLVCTGTNSQLSVDVGSAAAYCTAGYTYGTTSSDFITNVHLGSINNTTGASSSPYNTYYNTLSTNLTAGSTYTVTGTVDDGGTEIVGAWIDYNNDGVFSASEKLGEVTAGTAVGSNRPFSITFTVPLSANNAITRLRVRNVWLYTGIDPCNNYSFGEVEDYNVNITGGTSYSYAWSANTSPTFLSSTTISNPVATGVTAPRTYTVTVSEPAGCTATATVGVALSSGPLAVSLGQSPAGTFCPASVTTLTPTATGGCPPYTYAWSAGTTAATLPAVTVSPLTTTTYSVTVTDNSSNTVSTSISVGRYVVTAASISSSSPAVCGTSSVTLTATPAGAASYAWSGTALSSTSIANPVASPTSDQNYAVTITDVNSCTSVASITVPVFGAVSVSSVTASPPAFCAGNNSQLQVTASQASTGAYCTGSYNYGSDLGDYITNVTLGSINNTTGASSSPFNTYYSALSTNLTGSTVYTMTGTIDDGGTEGVAAWIDYNNDGIFSSTELLGQVTAGTAIGTDRPFSITFTVPATAINGTTRMRVRNVYNNTSIDPCNTYNWGEIEDYNVVISGATNPTSLSYTWAANPSLSSTSIANPIATAVPSTATYTVTVTGAGSCSATGTVQVTANPLPTVSITNPAAVCSPATVDLTAAAVTSGSTAGLTYTYWTNSGATLSYTTPSAATAGTYYIKGTTAAGCSDIKPVTVIINTPPAATASNAGPFLPGQTITITSGPSGQTSYLWHGPSGYSASTQDISRTLGTSAMAGTYTVTVTNASGCSATASTVVAVNGLGDYTWTGATSNVWTVVTNWSPTAPVGGPNGCTENVIIPNTVNDPVISSAVSVGNITVNDNAQLTLNANLSVCGFLKGGVTTPPLVVGNSHLIMVGTSVQDITGIISANTLEINNTSGGVGNSGNISINKALIMTNGQLGNAGTVTLVSNATGDAYLDNFTSPTAGAFNGNLIVQRYISNSSDGYRDISSPVATSVADLASSFSVFGQNGVDCWYAYNPYPNVQIYNEPFHIATGNFFEHWISYTGTWNYLTAMKGIAARTYNGAPYTITFKGAAYNGSQSIPITHTNTATPASDGWNFIGNPYPSPISWSAVKAMNSAVANGSFYVYHTTAEFAGNWGSHNGVTGVNGATDAIAIGQGFFVQTASPSTSFVMDNTVRTTASASYYRIGALDNEVRLMLSDGANSDEIVTYTDPQATAGYDPDVDAVKMPAGSTVGIAYSMPSHDYAINVMDALTAQTELPLTIYVRDTASYALAAISLNTPGLTAYLKDAQSGTLTSLTNAIPLTLNGGQMYTGRYSVVFKEDITGITNTTAASTHIYAVGNRIYVQRPTSDPATISVTNLLGQNITDVPSHSDKTDFALPTDQPWYAIVKVTEGQKVTISKILLSNK